jgi:mRNA interferase YafQ
MAYQVILSTRFKKEFRCCIKRGSDWLMTWEQSDTELTLLFLRTGTHSDLF